jgi:hypothetical protein
VSPTPRAHPAAPPVPLPVIVPPCLFPPCCLGCSDLFCGCGVAAESRQWDMLWSGKALKVDDFKGLNKNQKVQPLRPCPAFFAPSLRCSCLSSALLSFRGEERLAELVTAGGRCVLGSDLAARTWSTCSGAEGVGIPGLCGFRGLALAHGACSLSAPLMGGGRGWMV